MAQLKDRKPLLCLFSFLFAFAFDGSAVASEHGGKAVAATSSSPLAQTALPGQSLGGPSSHLCVANSGNDTITTYTTDGDRVSPTISLGVNVPEGVAVDEKSDRIYVANAGNSTITTYTKDGSRTSPTIVVDVNQPWRYSRSTRPENSKCRATTAATH